MFDGCGLMDDGAGEGRGEGRRKGDGWAAALTSSFSSFPSFLSHSLSLTPSLRTLSLTPYTLSHALSVPLPE